MARARARFFISGGQVVSEFGTKSEVLVKYSDAIGPFHTRRGANYFSQHPDCGGVAAAERACKTLDAPTVASYASPAVSDTIPSAAPEATQDPTA